MKLEKRVARNKQKTIVFIAKSKEKFPDQFDNTDTKYTGGTNKVSMKCIKHDLQTLLSFYFFQHISDKHFHLKKYDGLVLLKYVLELLQVHPSLNHNNGNQQSNYHYQVY